MDNPIISKTNGILIYNYPSGKREIVYGPKPFPDLQKKKKELIQQGYKKDNFELTYNRLVMPPAKAHGH